MSHCVGRMDNHPLCHDVKQIVIYYLTMSFVNLCPFSSRVTMEYKSAKKIVPYEDSDNSYAEQTTTVPITTKKVSGMKCQ